MLKNLTRSSLNFRYSSNVSLVTHYVLSYHFFLGSIATDSTFFFLSNITTDERFFFFHSENRTLDVDADIVFLLDASSFVSRENFVKEKDFVKSMAKVLNVAPESSRAAVILIGTFPDTKVTFNEYRTLRDFNELVDKAQSFGGSRRIDRALEEASKVLVDRRRGVPHVVVLVTGGKQSQSGNNIPFENAVKPLDKIGAHTFVVAIGHDPDTLKNVLPVPSFNDLQSRVYKMARQIKTTSGKYFHYVGGFPSNLSKLLQNDFQSSDHQILHL